MEISKESQEKLHTILNGDRFDPHEITGHHFADVGEALPSPRIPITRNDADEYGDGFFSETRSGSALESLSPSDCTSATWSAPLVLLDAPAHA